MTKKKVYIESTIPSYLVGRSSRDIIVLAHQDITQTWWVKCRHKFDLFVSPAVVKEVSDGDSTLSEKRLELIENITMLDFHEDIEKLAMQYFSKFSIPQKSVLDVFHIAYAVFHKIDFLLTWNCKHLANANIIQSLYRLNDRLGHTTPVICTPEELS
ncbi:MAG: type II toxin-antitoxin system VapC family toxin [Candidatus Margulisiibacteriota bacterium]